MYRSYFVYPRPLFTDKELVISLKKRKSIWSYSKAWIYCSQYVAISSQKGSKMALTELLLTKQKKPLKKGLYRRQCYCGEGGIRTHERVTPLLP